MANGSKVGITGHRGFVGRRLVPFLESRGFEVVVFEGDLLDCNSVAEFFNKYGGLTEFVHLAGGFFGTDSEVIEKNTIASANLANVLKGLPQTRVIIASSGAVYGNTGNTPANENRALSPNTLYGFTKKWAEEIFTFGCESSGQDLIILRLPSLYGPGNDKGVIHSWIKSIQQGSSIALHGLGDQARSFLHVDDLAEGISRLILSSETGAFNFAEKEPHSLKQLISYFEDNVEFTVKELPEQNQLQSMVIDSGKLYETFNWSPSHRVSAYIDDQIW